MDTTTKTLSKGRRRAVMKRIEQLSRMASPTREDEIEALELRRLVHLDDLAIAHPTAIAGIGECIANVDLALRVKRVA